jgi:hypothetical protein
MICQSCFGRGWILANNDTHGLRIERCDSCRLYPSDEAAVQVVAAHAVAFERECAEPKRGAR